MRSRPYKLAVVASHPIQYQAPLFRALAGRPEIDLHVYFCSRWGMEQYRDPGFGETFAWDIPLLEGYSYTFLRNLGFRSGPSSLLSVFNPGMLRALLSNSFHAVLIFGWALSTYWMTWAGGSLQGLPILLRGESNGLTEPAGVKGSLKRAVLKLFLSRIAGFLAIGTNNAAFYKSYGVPSERIFWTPYAVDNAFFTEYARHYAGQKEGLRQREGLPSNAPVILFSGKFQEKKRPLDLLQAFALLQRRVPATLVFAGDGPQRAEMERFVAEARLPNVYIVGFRNQRELPIYYALADVLVLPSRFEPWGLVVNEAMCFGLPIVASDKVGAAADLVKPGGNGFVFPAGNVDALAERLATILQDQGLRRRMGRASYEAISRWGIEQDVEGVLQALEAVTGRRERNGR